MSFFLFFFFFFQQKTAYEMRISDWSSDVCSSDLRPATHRQLQLLPRADQVLRAADGIGPGQTARAATAVFARNRSQGIARAYRISGQFRLARLGPADRKSVV